MRRDAAQGLLLSLPLSWLLAVPFCPAETAAALPGGQAPLFVGALLLGCALACACAAAARGPRRGARWLLPLGVGAALLASGLEPPAAAGAAAAAACGLAAGAGEAAVLLAWGRAVGGRPTPRLLLALAAACAGAGAQAVAFGALAPVPGGMGAALLAVSLGSMAAPRDSGRSGRACAAGAASARLGAMLGRMWEPLLGMGLSLMSAMLPWGSLVVDGSVTVPPAWSFGAGALLAGAAAAVAARALPGRVGYDTAVHVSVPLLAAAVVALRLVGDSSDAASLLSAPKGMLSGAAGAAFLACGWLAMGREAQALRGRGQAGAPEPDGAAGAPGPDPALPFALGLCCVCLVGASILPVHALNQQAASLAAPFLSLAFLAASSASSIVHMRRRAEERQAAPRPMGIEEAVEAIARDRRLSPRETQVLGQLVLGRSAEGIGAVLGISPNTVRSHIGNIHGKLGIQSRDQLADLIEQTMRADAQQKASSSVK